MRVYRYRSWSRGSRDRPNTIHLPPDDVKSYIEAESSVIGNKPLTRPRRIAWYVPAGLAPMDNRFDDISAYCRALGHYVPFRYCRTMNGRLPCGKIRDCWFERIDIGQFLKDNYSEAELESVFSPPAQKITTIIDLISRAREKNE